MKMTLKARDWHRRVSVILVVPMLLVGMTAIFMAHKKALALDELDLSRYVGWLPGYAGAKADKFDVRASLVATDGRRWLAGKEGLYRVVDGRAEAVPEFARLQVRDLVVAPWGLVAATSGGIWVEQAGAWRRAHKGNAWSASLAPDGSIAVAIKDEGLLQSRDGSRWTPLLDALLAASAAPAGERITLGKLAMDLHSGKAFFGKEAQWIWSDLLGAVLVFLGLSGVYLWWRAQIRRREAARMQFEAAHG